MIDPGRSGRESARRHEVRGDLEAATLAAILASATSGELPPADERD